MVVYRSQNLAISTLLDTPYDIVYA